MPTANLLFPVVRPSFLILFFFKENAPILIWLFLTDQSLPYFDLDAMLASAVAYLMTDQSEP